jgi:hypothetical protein
MFRPIHEEKYCGKVDKIVARSNLERAIFKFLDHNDNVKSWSSEEVIVPYVGAHDGMDHRYFVDIYLELKNGEKLLVEIKPASQCSPPALPSARGNMESYKAALNEYLKNQSKWLAARKYAASRGWRFVVWTENHLQAMGIRFVK